MSEGFYSRKTGDRWGEILENWEGGAEETALEQARDLIIDLDQEAAAERRIGRAFKAAATDAYSRVTQAQLDAGMTERVGSGVGDAANRLVAFMAGVQAEVEQLRAQLAVARCPPCSRLGDLCLMHRGTRRPQRQRSRPMDENCAHRGLSHVETKHADGTCSEKWECYHCGAEFRPFSEEALRADRERVWVAAISRAVEATDTARQARDVILGIPNPYARPDDGGPSMDKPCPHPDRRGHHEEYMRRDGSSVCRACGAGNAAAKVPPSVISAARRDLAARLAKSSRRGVDEAEKAAALLQLLDVEAAGAEGPSE